MYRKKAMFGRMVSSERRREIGDSYFQKRTRQHYTGLLANSTQQLERIRKILRKIKRCLSLSR